MLSNAWKFVAVIRKINFASYEMRAEYISKYQRF